jgi:hypothetical protein
MRLLLLGFTHPTSRPDPTGAGPARRQGLVRVIDTLGVRKGVDGEVEVLHNSQLGADQQAASAP